MLNLEDDIGQWTCYARFASVKNREIPEEGYDYIILTNGGSSALSVGTIILIVLLVIFTNVCFFVLLFYRRKRSQIHSDKTTLFEK